MTDVPGENLTAIYLSEEELRRFILFQKQYNLFLAMDRNEILNIQWGKVTLNFAGGQLQNIIKEEVVWKK